MFGTCSCPADQERVITDACYILALLALLNFGLLKFRDCQSQGDSELIELAMEGIAARVNVLGFCQESNMSLDRHRGES